ncbi:MAG: D-Ala-D-Ala carboxypeptidase family metallohydrolase, partial [Gemmatimonadota bacterium]|nr:D-Ala-D-Ala carboxypeptidase family metallohydrolase [Gemmatimonadota bacterium]
MQKLGPTDRVRRHRRFARRERLASLVIVSLAAIGVVQFFRPAGAAARGPFSRFAAGETRFVRAAAMGRGGHAEASRDAFGRSGEVRIRFSLPGHTLEFPLAVGGDPRTLRYEWLRLGDTTAADSSQALRGADVVTPRRAGFYRLAIRRGPEREVMTEPIVAVLMPFQHKVGGMLNGYRIGTYLTERLSGRDAEHPEGFLEVGPDHVELNVSTHLTVGDFITHDSQAGVWPKYVAINPRLLDKLELVIAEVQRRRGRVRVLDLALGVHSGFRTPWHNSRVPRAAGDSRHQYGDAADVVMDANGDGRITAVDGMLVANAVERVEYQHPDLAGGLGLYTGRQFRT